jgi:hypothetical protein
MPSITFEKREYPRLDTSHHRDCEIRVFGVHGKPLVARIMNISLGGVAFVSDYKNIARALKKYSAKVKIHLPDGNNIDANTTLLRVRPVPTSNDCICVMKLTEMNGNHSARLRKFIAVGHAN